MTDQMYMENILDHYKNPRNFSKMENSDICHKEHNPLCGDIVELFLKIDGNMVIDASFQGTGCAISQASTSLFTEFMKGKSVDEVKSLGKDGMLEMLGIEVSVLRLKCAVLSLKTFEVAVEGTQWV